MIIHPPIITRCLLALAISSQLQGQGAVQLPLLDISGDTNRQVIKIRMNKKQLLRLIVVSLTESLTLLERAARASHAEATHESSKAENKYDTRGLEAAYLARGQSQQAKEILESIKLYQGFIPRDFAPEEGIDLGALVNLESDGTSSIYFIGPKSGGLEIRWRRQEITVITPESPLSRQLMGKKAGQGWTVKIGGANVQYRVVSVQ